MSAFGGHGPSAGPWSVRTMSYPSASPRPTVNGSGGYDATASNPIGREFAVTVRKRF